MGKPGSEAAHEEKLRQLAGPEAQWIFDAAKKYPRFDADAVELQTAAGNVFLLEQGDLRILVYRHGDQLHGLVTELAHGGYRRRYRKVSGRTAAEVIAGVVPK